MSDEEVVPMDRLVRVYLKMKARISELTSVYEKEVEGLKAQQAEVANAMKDQMQSMGLTSSKTQFGTAILSTKTRFYAQDWDAMKRFILDNEAVDLLEKRIAQTNMKQFLEDNPGLVPPGLNSVSEVDISVRKPTK